MIQPPCALQVAMICSPFLLQVGLIVDSSAIAEAAWEKGIPFEFADERGRGICYLRGL